MEIFNAVKKLDMGEALYFDNEFISKIIIGKNGVEIIFLNEVITGVELLSDSTLKDKAGESLFIGDVISHSRSTGEVIFKNGGFAINWFIDKDDFSSNLSSHNEKSLKIGTIYERKHFVNIGGHKDGKTSKNVSSLWN